MFCKFLTNVYHFTYDTVKPCCWIKNTSASILNQDEIDAQFKQLHTIDTWTPECSYCHDLEKAGTASPRTQSLEQSIFDDCQIGDAIKIECQLDEECNAACLMCSTWNSTTWQKYTEKTVHKILPLTHKTTVDDRVAAVLNTIDFSKVKQIHFFGGEPFITDTHLRIIREVTHPENVNLVYVTNGSAMPDEETLALWSKFNNVNIAISIDGVGDHFNYLRWPLQWHQIENNLAEYDKLASDKITINCSFTVTPFNILYVNEYRAWAVKFFKNKYINSKEWFNNPNPAVGPINLACIPDSLRNELIKKYGEDNRLVKIIAPFDENQYRAFIEYVDFHDAHRNLNWRETFAIAAQYLISVDYPTDLLNFYNAYKDCTNPVHTSFNNAYQDTNCAYYPINFDFDTELLLKECQSVDDLYFNHRSQDKKSGYGHKGWQSLTLHGIDKHKTEHYTRYGFNSLEEANYRWTDVCARVPNLYKFLSSLPFDVFDRVRIMRLEPGGYVMPHTDGQGRIFSPLNIAINNPEDCYFVFKDAGVVPFVAGRGMVLDVAREHMVINRSTEPRYHIIVHGHYNKDFYKL